MDLTEAIAVLIHYIFSLAMTNCLMFIAAAAEFIVDAGILHLPVYTFVIPGMAALFFAAMIRNPLACETGWIPAFAGMT